MIIGAYAEYVAVSTHMLIPRPSTLSFVQCAAIPEVWITAIQALYLIGGFEAGKSVLWHAGASAVSIAGIQLSRAENTKEAGGKVFATTRSDEKNEWVKTELGADGAFNSKNADWAQKLMDASEDKGVDIIVDLIGAPVLQDNIDILGRDGR